MEAKDLELSEIKDKFSAEKAELLSKLSSVEQEMQKVRSNTSA